MNFLLKVSFVSTVCFVLFITTSFLNLMPEPYRIKTIVIDAGHGGKDPGCIGSIANEKDVALKIALMLGQYIEENIENVRIVYTRKTDDFIELHERAAIANKNNADLFISIHCNSGTPGIFGAETYTMGLHRTDANLKVAQFENSSILLEENYGANYDGFDPNSPESYIIFSLFQNANLEKSISLASKVQSQLEQKAKRKSRGVKQAGFLVLYKTTMPSIMVETGFLTDKNEEQFLNSEEGQSYIASAIYRSFKEYKGEVELSSN